MKSNTKKLTAQSIKKRHVIWIWIIGLIALLSFGIYMAFTHFVGPGVSTRALEFSKLPVDQPSPIPSSAQTNTMEHYCDIVTSEIANSLGASGEPIPIKGLIVACDIPLSGGALIQISSIGPYGHLSEHDKPHFAQPVTIAGLEGRIYNVNAPLSGECTLKLNTRSVTVPIINVRWNIANDIERATKRAQSCEIAQKAGEVFAKTYVPLAGGAVYQKTLQSPDPRFIEDYPCKLANDAAAIYGGVYNFQNLRNNSRQEQPSECVYEYGNNKAIVTLERSGRSIADLAGSLKNLKPVERLLGTLQALEIRRETTCTIAVELSPGILFSIAYTAKEGDNEACARSQTMQASSIRGLIDASSIDK